MVIFDLFMRNDAHLAGDNRRIRRDILINNRVCPNTAIVTYTNGTDNLGSCANIAIISNGWSACIIRINKGV